MRYKLVAQQSTLNGMLTLRKLPMDLFSNSLGTQYYTLLILKLLNKLIYKNLEARRACAIYLGYHF